MLESAIKSPSIALRTSALKGILHLLLVETPGGGTPKVPPIFNADTTVDPLPVTPEGGRIKGMTNALTSQLSTQLPRNALNALASQLKPADNSTRAGDVSPVSTGDTLLNSLTQLAAPYVNKACDA